LSSKKIYHYFNPQKLLISEVHHAPLVLSGGFAGTGYDIDKEGEWVSFKKGQDAGSVNFRTGEERILGVS
jgi:hypothetical protein